MSSEKCFFQDFLFVDMPVDNQDNPIVEINDLPADINHDDLKDCHLIYCCGWTNLRNGNSFLNGYLIKMCIS